MTQKMKSIIYAGLFCLVCVLPFRGGADERAAGIVRSLTLEEKVLLLSGRDDWHVGGIDRVGLPLMRVTDCGHGVTLAAPPFGSATCLPTSVGLASTWNEDLLFEAGALLGRETRAKGCGLLLGPMVNLHRLPLGGRNYETYSEDPLLTGKLAAALIRGIQSTGSGACIKAVACNNQQKDQYGLNVEVDERTLRELYLRAFELAVQEAQPWAIMTAYNYLDGLQPSENPHLLNDIIRQQWNFNGLLVSDWRAVRSPQALVAGLNLEMPGPGKQLNLTNIQQLLASGQLTTQQLDRAITPMVETLLKYAANTNGPSELDSPRHRALARSLADESLVLLKNDGLLPLDINRIKSLAVIGPNAAPARLGGAGSASVTPFYSVSVLDGLRSLAGDHFVIHYAEGGGMNGALPVVPATCLRQQAGADAPGGLQAEFFDNPQLAGAPCARRVDANVDFSWGWGAPMNGVPRHDYSARWTGYLVPPVTGKYRLSLAVDRALVRLTLNGKLLLDHWGDSQKLKYEDLYASSAFEQMVDLTAGQPVPIIIEFGDTGSKSSVRLQWEPPNMEDPIESACKIAAQSDAAVVCVGLANTYEGGAKDRSSYELPGRQVELIRRVAAANPHTAVVLINGSVVSVAEWLKSVPAVIEAWYPGQEGGNAIAAALFGQINPSGHLPDTIFRGTNDILAMKNYPGDGKSVTYTEGMKVGYRQIRPGDDSVVFPFGFGLSYTQFELKKAAYDGGVTVLVSNRGERTGSTVIQVYRERSQPADKDPWRELVAFRKIRLLPGETKTLRLSLPARAFQSWSLQPGQWLRDPSIDALWVTLDAQSGKKVSLPGTHLK